MTSAGYRARSQGIGWTLVGVEAFKSPFQDDTVGKVEKQRSRPNQESGNSNTQTLKPYSLDVSIDSLPREPRAGVSVRNAPRPLLEIQMYTEPRKICRGLTARKPIN